MDGDDADEASFLSLRRKILDEWSEDDRKDIVLEALDRLLLEKREGSRDDPSGRR